MNDNDLVFLVQLTGGPTAGRDKSVINAHVSKQTHSRRRRERILQAQRTQDSANTHEQSSERPLLPSLATSPQTVAGHLSPTWRQIDGYRSPHTSPPPGFVEEIDPSEGLDAKAEDYLRFGHEVLEPAIHSVGYRGWTALKAPREEFVGPDLLTGCILTDGHPHVHRADCFKVFAFAVLAYCASGVAAVSHSQYAQHDALNYTISCMRSLREYLDNLNHNIDDISEDLVYRLFRAEVLANNHPSASAHGRLLKKIFEYKAQSSPIRLDVLSNTLYQDSHRAFSSWSRPIFDQEWIEKQYQHEWQQANAMFDSRLDHEAHQLSNCLSDNLLRPLLVAVKRLFLHTKSLMENCHYATPRNFYWFASQCEWLQMCLMNYYLDRDQQNATPSDYSNEWSSKRLHLCVALATLYVLRHAKNDIHVQGRPIFKGCKNIYVQMDVRLSTLAKAMTREDSEQNLEAIVFMLFIAAIAEQHHFSINPASNVAYAWRRRLGQYLAANGIRDWDTVAEMLSRFPYTEQELPMPYDNWFQEVMCEATSG